MSKDKKNDGFSNNPFAALKSLTKKEESAKKPAPVQQQQVRSSSLKAGKSSQSQSDEERMFLDAMAGVAPVSRKQPLPVNVPQINARIMSEEAEALAQLYDLMSERGEFAISQSGATIEASAPGVDQRLTSALRRGEYAFQAQLDLTGLAPEAAKNAVDAFVTQSKRETKRCVLIIHGRGEKLRDELTTWLDRGRMGKLALAVSSAKPNEGGADAIYVLLRR